MLQFPRHPKLLALGEMDWLVLVCFDKITLVRTLHLKYLLYVTDSFFWTSCCCWLLAHLIIWVFKPIKHWWCFPGGSDSKEYACNPGHLGSIAGLGRSPGEEHGNPLQYSFLENPHGQRSLAGYGPWGCKESDTPERLSTAQDRAQSWNVLLLGFQFWQPSFFR